VAVVLMMAVCFAVAELLILNFGLVGLHRFTPRVSVMRLSFYAVVLGGVLIFHKRIERFLIENQCLGKSKICYFLACFAILLCTFFFYLYEKRLDGLRPHLIILATLAVLFILWAVGIVFIGDKVENNFLAVSISLLPLFSFLTKASHGVDEPSHFSEAYSVMMGHFFNLQYHGILPPPAEPRPQHPVSPVYPSLSDAF
jgi:hypothetical protein